MVQFLIVQAIAHSFFEFALVYQLAGFKHVFHPVEAHYDGCLRKLELHGVPAIDRVAGIVAIGMFFHLATLLHGQEVVFLVRLNHSFVVKQVFRAWLIQSRVKFRSTSPPASTASFLLLLFYFQLLFTITLYRLEAGL